jgi:hypothetical protein
LSREIIHQGSRGNVEDEKETVESVMREEQRVNR